MLILKSSKSAQGGVECCRKDNIHGISPGSRFYYRIDPQEASVPVMNSYGTIFSPATTFLMSVLLTSTLHCTLITLYRSSTVSLPFPSKDEHWVAIFLIASWRGITWSDLSHLLIRLWLALEPAVHQLHHGGLAEEGAVADGLLPHVQAPVPRCQGPVVPGRTPCHQEV